MPPTTPKLALTLSSVETPFTSLSLREHIPTERINALLSSPFVLPDNTEYSERDSLERVRDCIKGDFIETSFQFGKCGDGFRKFGRVYAEGSVSLGSIRRELRHTLVGDKYVDIDIKNAHPTFLLQICQANNISCPSLENYVLKRDDVLMTTMDFYDITKSDAKNLWLIPLFGGGFKKWVESVGLPDDVAKMPEWLSYKAECVALCKKLTDDNPDILEETRLAHPENNDYENQCSSTAIVLQEYERRVLEVVYGYLKSKKLIPKKECSPQFDGINIPKTREFLAVQHILPQQLSVEVYKKLGFSLTFTYKDMNEGYNITEYILNEPVLDIVGTLSPVDKVSYVEAREMFEKRAFYLRDQNAVVLESDDDLFMIDVRKKEQFNLREVPTVLVKQGKTNVIMPIIPLWLNDRDKRTFHRFVFQPNLSKVLATDYNKFKGFSVARVPSVSSPRVKLAVQRFKELVRNLTTERFEYVLKYIADIFQNPGRKPGVCILLSGEQGIGKDTICYILGKMLGNDLYFECKDPEHQLFADFTSSLETPILINLTELKGATTKANVESFKSLITSDTMRINRKHEKDYVVDSYFRIIASFNEHEPCPVVIEPGDRRFVLCYANNAHKGDAEYWTEIYSLFNDVECQKGIYDYLMLVDLTDFNPRVIVKTEAELDIMEINKPTEIKFVEYVAEKQRDETEVMMTVEETYDMYKLFCSESRIVPRFKPEFSRRISPFIGRGLISSVKNRIGGVQSRRYVFHIPKILPDRGGGTDGADDPEPLVNVREETGDVPKPLSETERMLLAVLPEALEYLNE